VSLAELVANADNIVVFTGAGISTESGIPDYRGRGGVWTTMKPILFDDYLRSEEARKETWRRRFEGEDPLQVAKPNDGHYAIAALVACGKAKTVITQNIDNLHQSSGITPQQIVELHGNASFAKCLDCGTRVDLDTIRSQYRQMGTAAACESCGGLVKTATISFGQAMPQDAMRRAQEATLGCDLFLAIGSSLTVAPANGFPVLAKRNGARLAILNRDPTELDPYADLVVQGEIGVTLRALIDDLGLSGFATRH
jgi:NAD-dependent protein deacetylase/lipoamidase